MKRIKIAFMAPQTKGGPHFIYQEIVEWIKSNHSEEIECHLYNTSKEYLGLHFRKFDYIFSVIPFLFKPFGAKHFIFNPHGNRTKEKKEHRIGNKLLYLANRNLRFCDQIMLPSYFLADQLGFKKRYKKKIFLLPNFIDTKQYHKVQKNNDNKIKILTITSFKFYEKGKGIVHLGNIIKTLGEKTDQQITWTIIGNDSSKNFQKISGVFNQISFGKNIKILRKGWVDKKIIHDELHHNDLFLYRTHLDNFPMILLEAMATGLPVLVNNFTSFSYFMQPETICSDEKDMVHKIEKMIKEHTLTTYGKANSDYVKTYDKDLILQRLLNHILHGK